MPPIIQFENVSKRYNLGLTRVSLPGLISRRVRDLRDQKNNQKPDEQSIWALKDVSFTLDRGQSLALVGQNGAGKTTILKLLSRITLPTSGKIDTQGRLSALIELGAGFHPDLTGRENIFLNGTILGLKRREVERQFDEIVAFSELERFIDTPVKRYSSGMAVRLGFAVASSIEPDILLVDEVLAVGDASFQQKCLRRIESLLEQGTSIVFVSHNLYLVQAVCEQALYIRQGELIMEGATLDVIAAYERDIHQKRASKLNSTNNDSVEFGVGFDITRVEVKSELISGDESQFRSDLSAEIQIHYQAFKDIGELNVAAYVVRSDGVTCCMMRTSLDDYKVVMQEGSGEISLWIDPLQVISGTYYVEIFFLNDSDSMVISSSSSDWFEVTGAALSYEERSGIFQPNSRWSHTHAELEKDIIDYTSKS